jgi:hypothetical protein
MELPLLVESDSPEGLTLTCNEYLYAKKTDEANRSPRDEVSETNFKTITLATHQKTRRHIKMPLYIGDSGMMGKLFL